MGSLSGPSAAAKGWHDRYPVLSHLVKQLAWWLVLGVFAIAAAIWEPSRSYLGDRVLVARWIVGALALAAAGSLVWHVVLWRRKLRKPKYLSLRHLDYMGIRWRWRYSGSSSEPYDLTTYCPRCDGQLLVKSLPQQTCEFSCGVCSYSTTVSGKGLIMLEHDVQLMIRQRIRSLGGDPNPVMRPTVPARYT
jgi:hypothetical protein